MTFCRTKAIEGLIAAGIENSDDWRIEGGKTEKEAKAFRVALTGLFHALPMADRVSKFRPCSIDCEQGVVSIHFDSDEEAHDFFNFISGEEHDHGR